MTPDPVFDKLARFTPDPGTLDPADVLYRAGRASARTPVGWKVAVAVLVVSNVLIFLNRSSRPDVVVLQAHAPTAESPATLPPPAPEVPSWGPNLMLGAFDPDRPPRPEAVADLAPARAALTPLSARRAEFD